MGAPEPSYEEVMKDLRQKEASKKRNAPSEWAGQPQELNRETGVWENKVAPSQERAPGFERQQEIKEESKLLQSEENVVETKEPLTAKIPKLTAPPTPKKTEPAVKPKPTQEELLADEIQSVYTPRLINYLKQVEGTSKQQAQSGSFKGGRFRTFDDVGSPAIGYGHRLLPGEEKEMSKGITEERATQLLMQDIKKAEIDAQKHFGKKGWEAMDQHRREMAIDFVYNLGLGREGDEGQKATGMKAFKSFSRALRQGDIKTIRARYKRYFRSEEGAPMQLLKQRNDPFYKTFIMPLETGEIEIGQKREPSR